MKKLLFILFASIIFASCATFYGPNLNELSKRLELGMSRQESVSIMGKDYFIESSSQTPDGKVEILHFRSAYYQEYLLYFLNDELVEFHRYIPPQQDIRVIKEENNK